MDFSVAWCLFLFHHSLVPDLNHAKLSQSVLANKRLSSTSTRSYKSPEWLQKLFSIYYMNLIWFSLVYGQWSHADLAQNRNHIGLATYLLALQAETRVSLLTRSIVEYICIKLHCLQHTQTPWSSPHRSLKSADCETFLPHLSSAVVEHKSESFLTWMENARISLVSYGSH